MTVSRRSRIRTTRRLLLALAAGAIIAATGITYAQDAKAAPVVNSSYALVRL
ncbi:MAG: hypothetical protein JOY78_00235 [Pseudonocardia sp.]|nr:hypothetical protein [Pseudonocardia sp.]